MMKPKKPAQAPPIQAPKARPNSQSPLEELQRRPQRSGPNEAPGTVDQLLQVVERKLVVVVMTVIVLCFNHNTGPAAVAQPC
jgi:hypothetical protein